MQLKKNNKAQQTVLLENIEFLFTLNAGFNDCSWQKLTEFIYIKGALKLDPNAKSKPLSLTQNYLKDSEINIPLTFKIQLVIHSSI